MESIERLNCNNHIEQDDTVKKESIFTVFKRYAIEMLIYIAISVVIILVLRALVVQHVRVSGSSMEPTLDNRQHLLIEKISHKVKGIKRYDVIVFQPFSDDNKLFYIKRVIGLPGETVKIENNIIYINGKKLNDPYGYNSFTDAKLAKDTIMLGANDYFVLGDNREVSKDSREKEIGLLTDEAIIGKAFMKIYPFNDVGSID